MKYFLDFPPTCAVVLSAHPQMCIYSILEQCCGPWQDLQDIFRQSHGAKKKHVTCPHRSRHPVGKVLSCAKRLRPGGREWEQRRVQLGQRRWKPSVTTSIRRQDLQMLRHCRAMNNMDFTWLLHGCYNCYKIRGTHRHSFGCDLARSAWQDGSRMVTW